MAGKGEEAGAMRLPPTREATWEEERELVQEGAVLAPWIQILQTWILGAAGKVATTGRCIWTLSINMKTRASICRVLILSWDLWEGHIV